MERGDENPAMGQVIKELARLAFAPEDDSGVRTADRLKSLELLGKHMGMFSEGARPQIERPVIVDDVFKAGEEGDGG